MVKEEQLSAGRPPVGSDVESMCSWPGPPHKMHVGVRSGGAVCLGAAVCLALGSRVTV